MCNIGDIILVKEYVDNGKILGQHSFIVISDESDQIEGLDYDIICNVMSSFKNKEHKNKKLKYSTNFPVTYNDVDITDGGNNKEGYIKSNQFYYFNKNKLDYQVIGSLNSDVFNKLLELIDSFDLVRKVTDNL